ncbi:MAG TPA: hypothetical protein VGI39_30670 [Polyangiaceae bacterium]
MLGRASLSVSLPLLLVCTLGACGGGGGSSGSKTANEAKAVPTAENVSIGDQAIAQGGLDSLGGGRNRSDAAGAAAGSLRFDRLDRESPVKLDGSLREWPGRTAAKKVLSGDATKTSFAVALQYDDARIYVGGEVGDSAFVRSARFGDTEDHAVFTLAFPAGSGAALAAYDVGIFAGEPGESAGTVRFASGARRGREVPGAKIVEAPATGGYTFEVAIPWSAFPEGRTTRVGLRGNVRYVDSDGPNAVRAVVATGDGDAAHASTLPGILTEAEQAILEGLLIPKGLLGSSPRFDLVADVAGDALKERISVYDKFLTICGPHYRGGTQYFFRDLGAEVVSLDARPVTGRAKDDLILQRRFDVASGTRQWFEVWSVLGGGDEPQTAFGHEIAVAVGTSHVDNAVHVSGRDIEVATEPAVGFDPASYREPTTTDVDPVLLPWGPVKSQVFRFDGTKFSKVKEVAQQPAPGAPGAPAPADTYANTLAQARAQEPATPDVGKGRDLSKEVFALYKRDHGDASPRFDMQVNVAGDSRPERVVLMGRDLVVFGPGFKNGTGYASLTLSQFASDDDVKEVSARDLTGDGAADLVVRGVRHVNAQGVQGPVETDSLFVYQVGGDTLARIFAIETGRESHHKRVQGLVQFVPADDHKSFEIDARPGLAKGWTKKTYPWSQDPTGGSVEPLLLPWGGIADVRYAWDGSRFTAKVQPTGPDNSDPLH